MQSLHCMECFQTSLRLTVSASEPLLFCLYKVSGTCTCLKTLPAFLQSVWPPWQCDTAVSRHPIKITHGTAGIPSRLCMAPASTREL